MFSFLKKSTPDKIAAMVVEKPRLSWVERLKSGLSRTGNQLADLFSRGGKIDDDLYEELETILITADVGMDATNALLADLRRHVREHKLSEAAELKAGLAHCLLKLLKPLAIPLQADTHKPFVIMMVGVNGAGKTTSIGKLAKYLQSQGLSVLLAAGDTFRAAAREQLMTWGERNNVTVIAQQSGDAAAVIYDAVQAAQARKIDVVLADTAGRLTTQAHLMEEIKKVKRVIAKVLPDAPHEVLLVLDANTGQNALSQVKAFDQALGVTGLILTKLDGTAKGGVIAAIAKAHPIPVRFIGVGEGLDDLRPFVAEEFIAALLGQSA
ncbi:MAG TPA: signal recognition particle-docking protein FtsY [Gallionella sp.]